MCQSNLLPEVFSYLQQGLCIDAVRIEHGASPSRALSLGFVGAERGSPARPRGIRDSDTGALPLATPAETGRDALPLFLFFFLNLKCWLSSETQSGPVVINTQEWPREE